MRPSDALFFTKSTMDYALSFTRHFLVKDNALVAFEALETGTLVSYWSAIVISWRLSESLLLGDTTEAGTSGSRQVIVRFR
jgi:hypothetical protein